MKIALIQFNAGPDKNENLRRALSFISSAADNGAKFVLLPEMFLYRGDLLNRKNFEYAAETIPGQSMGLLTEIAALKKIFVLAGSIVERALNSAKAYNTSVLIDPKGKIISRYQKINLFDANLGRKMVNEARCFLKGKNAVMSQIQDFRVGMSICYDLRFPELFQKYRSEGAHLLVVPSCFSHMTGQAHWEVLLRARAIETQCYVLAPNQIGKDARGVLSYGNSMVINPWGEILARGSANKEETLTAEISLREIKIFQKVLPGIRKSV